MRVLLSWQQSRTVVVQDTGAGETRVRKRGTVTCTPDAEAKNLIECAYREGETQGLLVWCHIRPDLIPPVLSGGQAGKPRGEPARRPSE